MPLLIDVTPDIQIGTNTKWQWPFSDPPKSSASRENAQRYSEALCQAFTEVSTFMTQLHDHDSAPSYGILDQNRQIVYDSDYPAINYAIDEPITSTPCKVGLCDALWNIANVCGISLSQPEAA